MIALFTALAVCAGLSFAIQGPTNTRLSHKIGNLEASLASFTGGIIFMGIIVLIMGSGDLSLLGTGPWWAYLGGVFGALIVISITYAAPHLGFALTVTIIMTGQLIIGILVDAFGWCGTEQIPVEFKRVIGCFVIITGLILVYIGKKKAEGKYEINMAALVAAVFAFAAGVGGGIQAPANAKLATIIGQTEASWMNFVEGFIFVFVALLITTKGDFRKLGFVGDSKPAKGEVKPWMLLGGVWGSIGIFINVSVTHIIGVGILVTANLFGEIGGAMILDATGFLAEKQKMNAWRYIGMLLIFAGVLLV